MHFAIAVAAVLALPLLAAASPAVFDTRQSAAGSCNTGPIKCCAETLPNSSQAAQQMAQALNLDLGPVDALLGLNCAPVSVVGVGNGGTCKAGPVCCTNNAEGGLISVGCVPVSL